MRPVLNATEALSVKFSLQLLRISEFDLKNQVLTTLVWLNHEWKDELLSWDPSDFNGITSISVPNDQIWLPDIALVNKYLRNMQTG